jgi:hypothetical protein
LIALLGVSPFAHRRLVLVAEIVLAGLVFRILLPEDPHIPPFPSAVVSAFLEMRYRLLTSLLGTFILGGTGCQGFDPFGKSMSEPSVRWHVGHSVTRSRWVGCAIALLPV